VASESWHEGTDSHAPAVTACNTHGLPLQPLGDGGDPEAVLRDCADDHVHMRRVLSDLREAIMEQVGNDQTDRVRHALADAEKALSERVE
jgi:hypothetical protein